MTIALRQHSIQIEQIIVQYTIINIQFNLLLDLALKTSSLSKTLLFNFGA